MCMLYKIICLVTIAKCGTFQKWQMYLPNIDFIVMVNSMKERLTSNYLEALNFVSFICNGKLTSWFEWKCFQNFSGAAVYTLY